MPKRNKKSPPTYKSSYLIIILTIAITIATFFLPTLFPQPVPVSYFVKVIDRIGAPEGFRVNPVREHVSKSAFEHAHARRTYIGEASFETLKEQMAQRILDAGFENVTWREKTSSLSEGLVATCKDLHIFVGIQQVGNDPIDIKIIRNGDKNAPDCPQL